MHKLLILLGLLLFSAGLNAQIVFEQSYAYSATQTMLENDGQKFFLMDVPSEQCRIYNSDFSLWKTVQFDIPSNQYLADIKFVSQNVFNTDNQVEMLIMYYKYFETQNSYYYEYTTEVIGENGQVLLSVPGGAFAELAADSESGSTLFIYAYDYSEWPYDVETRIYNVPGKLTGVENILDPTGIYDSSQFSVYPNPNNGLMTLGTGHYISNESSRLIIRDIQGKEVYNVQLQRHLPEHQIELMNLDPGTYFYEVSTPQLKLKPKKLVIIK